MSIDLVVNPYKTQLGPELIGRKAYGLTSLAYPNTWTPPFVVVTTKAYMRWQKEASRWTGPYSNHWLASEGDLAKYVSLLSGGRRVSLVIRSSAVSETLKDRGRYKSEICGNELESVIKCIHDIWHHASDSLGASAEAVAVIIQMHRCPKASGHLSNERRVSRRIIDWVYEVSAGDKQSAKIARFTLKNQPQALADPSVLSCGKSEDIEQQLRIVAASTPHIALRHHYEWIWDGRRIWIVQQDLEEVVKVIAPGGLWKTIKAVDEVDPLMAFVKEADAVGDWNKVRSVREFRECGLPYASVYVLEDKRTLAELIKGNISLGVSSDLSRLLQLPIVIRTEVKETDKRSGLLRPKTDCVKTVDEATRFITKTAKQFATEGLECDEFCFIAHRFIAAKACALSLSKPDNSRVRVDATWGLPDSLQFYPHDSFEVDVRKADSIKKRVRCKTEYVDVDEGGNWIERSNGRPYDWQSTLTDDELLNIARFTRKLSICLQKPVSVMFFVGVASATGHPPCLPWYSTTKDIPDMNQEGEIRGSARRLLIAGYNDLERLPDELKAVDDVSNAIIWLKPKPELIRDADFIEKTASVARDNKLPIELEGSILSHAYYIISRAQVKVRCTDPFQPKLTKKKYGKLVRDLIPVQIESQGEIAASFKVTVDQLIPLLKAKAVEEALELYWENDGDKAFEELADLLEVVVSICDAYRRTPDELQATAETKRNERGGFKEGLVLVETREAPLFSRGVTDQSLFTNIVSVQNTSTSQEEGRKYTRMETSRPRQKGKNILLPLIPPSSRSNETTTISLSDGQELLVTYMDKEISVVIRPSTIRDAEAPQTSLFDD